MMRFLAERSDRAGGANEHFPVANRWHGKSNRAANVADIVKFRRQVGRVVSM
jgi:hypothetical protein